MGNLVGRVQAIVCEKHLLKHHFYQSWQQGKVPRETLRRYAVAYLGLTQNLPLILKELVGKGRCNEFLIHHILDEEDHIRLFRYFCHALGLTCADLYPASQPATEVRPVIAKLKDAVQNGVHHSAAAMYVYESQLPEVAKTKREGLRRHYGINDYEALAFFTVHAEQEGKHIGHWLECLQDAPEDPGIIKTAKETADALNAMLDPFVNHVRLHQKFSHPV